MDGATSLGLLRVREFRALGSKASSFREPFRHQGVVILESMIRSAS